MGVKLARPLFMGTRTLQLAPSKWVLYLIKTQVGLYAVSIFRSTINGFQQHSTDDYELDCKMLSVYKP